MQMSAFFGEVGGVERPPDSGYDRFTMLIATAASATSGFSVA